MKTNQVKRLTTLALVTLGVLFIFGLGATVFSMTMTAVPATPNNNQANDGWTAVLTSTFEIGFDPTWITADGNGSVNGEYYWGPVTFTNTITGHTQSAWAVGAGADGISLTVGVDGYPNQANSWLVMGPFSLTQSVQAAALDFEYWLEIDNSDFFNVAIANNNILTTIFTTTQNSNGWLTTTANLDNFIGKNDLYLAFNFTSNASTITHTMPGVLIDNILVRVQSQNPETYLPIIRVDPTLTPTPTPTNTATPTSTPTPSPTPTTAPQTYYRNDFADDADDWDMRRTTADDSDWHLTHRPGEYDSLQIELDSTDTYIIASPFIPGPQPPFTIKINAVMMDRQERHTFGMVFAADGNAESCPNSDFSSCFNHYYVLRVEKRADAIEPFQFKLKRIDFHDSGHNDPQGPDLIDWTPVSAIVNHRNKWTISVDADGDMRVYLNDSLVGQTNDSTYLNNDRPYFGLLVQTKQNGDASTKFDYIEVKAK